MKVSFSGKEIKTLVIASIILGFVFGFDDKRPVFELSFWLINYFTFVVMCLISLIIFYMAEKKSAFRSKSSTSFEIWNIRRMGFTKGAYAKKPAYIGIFIPIILSILSGGLLSFAAVTQSNIITRSAHRVGREFAKLSDFELSRISTAGPFTLTVLALITRLFANIIPSSDKIIFVFLSIAISNMLPLPNLNGIKAYFGSRLNYVFFLSFIVLVAIMIKFISAILTFIIALIITLIIFITFYKIREVELKN